MCHASLFTSSAFPKAELFFACMVVIILSSQPKELDKNKKELQTFRQVVDAQINETILTLQKNGFDSISLQLRVDLKPKLAQAPKKVDAYAEIRVCTSSTLRELA